MMSVDLVGMSQKDIEKSMKELLGKGYNPEIEYSNRTRYLVYDED